MFDESRVPVFLPDIAATYGFAAVVALALALVLVLVAQGMIGAQFSTHRLVLSLPKVLPRMLVTAFALFIGATLALHFLVFHPDRRLGWWYMAAITVTHLVAAAALAFLFLGAGRPPFARHRPVRLARGQGEDLDEIPPDRFTQGDAPSDIVNIKLDNGISGHSDYWIDPGFTYEQAPA